MIPELLLILATAGPMSPWDAVKNYTVPIPSPKQLEQAKSLGMGMAKPPTPAFVLPGFSITNLVVSPGSVILSWNNGTAPFQLWGTPALGSVWSTVGNTFLGRQGAYPTLDNHFWRIQAQAPSHFTLNTNSQPRLNWDVPDTDMSDSLTPFIVEKSTDNQQTWTAITGSPFGTSVRSATDTTTPPVAYRIRETTANGVVVPYPVMGLSNVQSGHLNWVLNNTGDGNLATCMITGMALDSSGRIVFCGNINSSTACTIVLGGTTMTGKLSGFIGRLKLDGSVDYVKLVNISSDAQSTCLLYGIVVASDNSIVVCGDASKVADFGNGVTISTVGSSPTEFPTDMLVVKFDASGVAQWAKSYGPGSGRDQSSQCVARAIGIGSDNSVFVTGYIWGTVTIGSFTLNAASFHADVPTFRLSADGNTVSWAVLRSGTGNNQNRAYGIAVDTANNAWVAGVCVGGSGSFDPGGGAITATGWMTKFSGSDGSYVSNSQKALTLGDATDIVGIAVNRSDNSLYLSGNSSTAFDFGNGKSIPFAGAFLAKFNSSGVCQWARGYCGTPTIPQTQYSLGTCVAVDSSGNVFNAGRLKDNGNTFDGLKGANPGYFVSSYDPNNNLRWAFTFNGPNASAVPDEPLAIVVAGANVAVGGEWNGTVDFGGIDGGKSTTTSPVASHWLYIANYIR